MIQQSPCHLLADTLLQHTPSAVWSQPPMLACLQIQLPLPYQILVVLGHAIFGAFEYKRFTNFQKYGEVGLPKSALHPECQNCTSAWGDLPPLLSCS